jgi:hypothetical protein
MPSSDSKDITSTTSASRNLNANATALDLEKQDTETQSIQNASRSKTARSRGPRVIRTQSITGHGSYRNHFTHPLSHVKTSEAELVEFDGEDDPYRPMNWPFRKKVITTLLYGLTTMGATWSTSVYSPAIMQIDEEFGVSQEVGTLGTTFLLLGFGFGPLLWAPLSEV